MARVRSRRRATARLWRFEPPAQWSVAWRDLIPAGVVVALWVVSSWLM